MGQVHGVSQSKSYAMSALMSFGGILAAVPIIGAVYGVPQNASAQVGTPTSAVTASAERNYEQYAHAYMQGYLASTTPAGTDEHTGGGCMDTQATTGASATQVIGQGGGHVTPTSVHQHAQASSNPATLARAHRTPSQHHQPMNAEQWRRIINNSYNTYQSSNSYSSTTHNTNSNNVNTNSGNTVGSNNTTRNSTNISHSDNVLVNNSTESNASNVGLNHSLNNDSYNTRTNTSIVSNSGNTSTVRDSNNTTTTNNTTNTNTNTNTNTTVNTNTELTNNSHNTSEQNGNAVNSGNTTETNNTTTNTTNTTIEDNDHVIRDNDVTVLDV